MGTKIAMWRIDGEPRRVQPAKLALESRLEDIIETQTDVLGQPILLIGRQVPTKYGKFIDLLGVNADGDVVVIELKRDRTPRDVVAQVLDYASWVQDLENPEVRAIFDDYQRRTGGAASFDEAFAEVFGDGAPDDLNTRHQLIVVASDMDDATERLVAYLSGGYQVPINVLLLDYFADGDREYLARTWLIDDASVTATRSGAASAAKKQAAWNGHDWYVSFGEEAGGRSWDDARTHGFVSAGGGEWFSRTMRQLPVGARVLTHIPKSGYVAVGEVLAPARPFEDAVVDHDGSEVPLSSLALQGTYVFPERDDDQDQREWVVPVRWLTAVPRAEAFWKPGFFANQNSACKLRNEYTISEVSSHFGLD